MANNLVEILARGETEKQEKKGTGFLQLGFERSRPADNGVEILAGTSSEIKPDN